MSRLLQNKILQFLGGVSQIYVGLGWLGLVRGFANTGSIFSIVGGFLFMLSGFASVLSLLKKSDLSNSDKKLWPEPSLEIIALIRNGKKVAAIKAYRKQTGAGLREAVDVIEKNTVAH